jgi:hypothetical protein
VKALVTEPMMKEVCGVTGRPDGSAVAYVAKAHDAAVVFRGGAALS